MAGPIKMYAMRPIVRHDMPVTLPTCMYSLPIIQGAIDGDGVVTAAKSNNGTTSSASVELVGEQNNQTMTMALVQQRQEVILQQLEDLKKQMTAIRDTLRTSSTTSCAVNAIKGNVKNTSSCDSLNVKLLPTEISINVNPSNPPYFLLLLQKMWKNKITINIQSYIHSTVTQLPENTRAFVQSIPEPVTSSNLTCLTVRLIWKTIGVNQLELTGARPIQGEVNLLRYLARLTSSLNYNDNIEMDSYLDTCYNISRSKTKSERLPLFQRLNKKLGKEKFIFGDFSIVDIAAYSAIKQTAGAGEVNVGMTKWMNNCEAYN
ncbi:probable aminoacyl tRNA synthase complex-interacting multifunctional protein 2 isoform X2 [Atheta coriaria]|uniref:probable aminoacyl tRNA synthase complex-interacting multifunctional protein 2 isoform X2 n=1 Tax=Dalotia coriaria TaxID=877792 RepID=UPI0031F381C4